jgi:hypothetical protein
MRSSVSAISADVKIVVFLFAAILSVSERKSVAQGVPMQDPRDHRTVSSLVCNAKARSAAEEALQLVCQRSPITITPSFPLTKTIVIGFVGGFVMPDDIRHPEVLFSSYLRGHFANGIDTRVFSNHHGKDALAYLVQLLDTDHDGILSTQERQRARIIVYGHSWGASETVAFARQLAKLDISVLLTIQVDTISKPGQKPSLIPPNVANAINFYQQKGPLHGRPKIVASDPISTTILGNIRMEYTPSSINCENYNWFVRTFNKPHHEIENDPRVWDQIASIIDSAVMEKDRADRSLISVVTGTQAAVP